MISIFIGLLSWLTLAIAQGTGARPSEPFYNEPENLGSYQPGEIIRQRTVGATYYYGQNLHSIVQVVYKTRLTLGNESYSVASIFIPKNPDPNLKVYGYLTFEDAVQLYCAPSYTIETGLFSPNSAIMVSNITLALSTQLDQGRYVVIPDEEGIVSAYFGGNQEGYAGLDALRATRNFINGTNETPFVLYGYSGGAQAVTWMASLNEGYAPDVNIIGVASGGTMVDAWGTLNHIDPPEGPLKGSVCALVTGLLVAYPPNNETLWPHIDPLIQQTMITLRDQPQLCLAATQLVGYTKSIRSNIDVDLQTFPASEYIFSHESLLFNVSAVPVPVPKFPRYMYHGGDDEVAPLAQVQQYVAEQNGAGANITLQIFPGVSHIPAVFYGLGDAFAWMDEIFKNY